jgi:hypothetical protein
MVASRAQRSNRGPWSVPGLASRRRVSLQGPYRPCAPYAGRVGLIRAVCGCCATSSVCSMANRCWQMRCAAFVCWGEPSTVRRICFDNLRAARRCASICRALACGVLAAPRRVWSSGIWSNNGSVSAIIAGIPRRVHTNIIELLYIYTIVSPGAELNAKRPSWASIRIVVFGW